MKISGVPGYRDEQIATFQLSMASTPSDLYKARFVKSPQNLSGPQRREFRHGLKEPYQPSDGIFLQGLVRLLKLDFHQQEQDEDRVDYVQMQFPGKVKQPPGEPVWPLGVFDLLKQHLDPNIKRYSPVAPLIKHTQKRGNDGPSKLKLLQNVPAKASYPG